ncbi:MAG: hydroxymethylbilane synthase [Thermoflavifilum sp.]|nr:hydroxymethylbilane synthase [Thermoflavifilum sp.]MCL6514488.1 hydroxymethylbilane synthase [Alicyclobacillus sp.]
MRHVRVASRRSALAMRQTEWVIAKLREACPDWTFEIVPVVTKGDRWLQAPLSEIGGKGLFVSEIEQMLQAGQADLAVHSLKDMPADLGPGLVLAGIPAREDPRDALIARGARTLDELPKGAVIGTSSLRRGAQLRACRPDLVIQPLRGNIDTRLRKLAEDNLDAIVLAAAGLHRMGWADRITAYLPPEICLPAPGQGLLGLECREDDAVLREALKGISDPDAHRCALAERAFLAALGGGCQVPMGALAEVQGNAVRMRALVASRDGEVILRAETSGTDPEVVGADAAQALRAQGAERLLAVACEP